jgi:DNA-binding transcriptional MocR family regulator
LTRTGCRRCALRSPATCGHLTRHQHLPTDPAQIVVTSGAQDALRLLAAALRPDTLVATCPTYPGLLGAFGPGRRVVPLPLGPSGPDPGAVERAARSAGTLVYLMPTGHNPVGHVLPTQARQAIAAVADRAEATIVEDLALADLHLGPGPAPPPLAALSPRVVAVGSVAKLLWGGLRVGWIRADEPLRSTLIAAKPVAAAVSQAVTERLLAGVDEAWLSAHRTALARRRDHLAGLIADRLPAWRVTRPAAGLSMWVEVPVADVATFAHTAARHGVLIAPGATACVDRRHHQFTRLSFAEQFDTLTLAADRLAVAWRSYGGVRDDSGEPGWPTKPAH